MTQDFPPRLDQKFYLTEGGTETEILYKWGFELPEFAMFPLLDDPEADTVIRNMYRRYFDVAAAQETGLLILGHDSKVQRGRSSVPKPTRPRTRVVGRGLYDFDSIASCVRVRITKRNVQSVGCWVGL